MRTKLREIKERLMATRHDGIDGQGKWLAQVLRGWMAYYAVPIERLSDLSIPASHDRTLAQSPTAPRPAAPINMDPNEDDR
jgi:hypothetical protein